MGLKAAETDATKRALATFGNPIGLALYDKDQSQVTRRSKRQLLSKSSIPPSEPSSQDLVLRLSDGREDHFSDTDDFVEAVRSAIAAVSTLDALYAFWEANLASLRALRRLTKDQPDEPVAGIVFALKNKAREFGQASEIRPGRRMAAMVSTKSPPHPCTWLSPRSAVFATKRISSLSLRNRVSSAGDGPRTPTICALPNPVPWVSRCRTSSPYRCAMGTITLFTRPEMSAPGGHGTVCSSP